MATTIIEYVFNTLRLTLIKADLDDPNTASIRALEKSGMKLIKCETTEERPLLYFES